MGNLKLFLLIVVLFKYNLDFKDLPFVIGFIVWEAFLYIGLDKPNRVKIGWLFSLLYLNPIFLVFFADDKPIVLMGEDALGKFLAKEVLKKVTDLKNQNPKTFDGFLKATVCLGLGYGFAKTGIQVYNFAIDNFYLLDAQLDVQRFDREMFRLNELRQNLPVKDLPTDFSQRYVDAYDGSREAHERQLRWESKKWV